MRTCDNRRMPRPATGKTPVRNARIADRKWLRLLARADLEGRSASDVLDSLAGDYGNGSVKAAYELTFANWPEAADWARPREDAVADLARDLFQSAGIVGGEWLTVAVWRVTDRYPSDPDQQQRVLAGHVLRAATASGDWTREFRGEQHLLDTVQAVIARHWPFPG